MPVTWDEVSAGIRMEDFRLDNARERIARLGDLWKPLLGKKGRTDLLRFFGSQSDRV
jgi:bifunctional non-homologous end joining protein LigD